MLVPGITVTVESDSAFVHIGGVDGATAYVLECGVDEDFTSKITSIVSEAGSVISGLGDNPLYVRVRAIGVGEVSEWSRTVTVMKNDEFEVELATELPSMVGAVAETVRRGGGIAPVMCNNLEDVSVSAGQILLCGEEVYFDTSGGTRIQLYG